MSLIAYFQFYWQETNQQLITLQNDIQRIAIDVQQSNSTLRQSSSLHQLQLQIEEIKQKLSLSTQSSSKFIAHLQHIIANADVVLHRLHPSINDTNNEKYYTIEVQGNYTQIYRFIHALISPSSHQTGLFSGVMFKTNNGYLTATLAISFIKDDIKNEQ
nr:hypothetical protein [Providencia burhodogranariea]